jgi:anthranilate synthase/aminodeoxychorismate synthase-like glutamine amidotransferase
MIDNYDSFTYNIVQYLGELGHKPDVLRNDDLKEVQFESLDIEKLIISPGPCTPSQAGISCAAIKYFSEKSVPVFGVCLGHQCIAEVFGGKVVHAPYLMHGKISKVFHSQDSIFQDIPSPFTATRYHSLSIEPGSLDKTELEVIAKTEDDIILGIRHKTLPLFGVQFHPESILTEHGHKILKNFLEI